MHLHVLLQVLPHTVYSEIADIKISRKVPFDPLLVVFLYIKYSVVRQKSRMLRHSFQVK